MDKVERLTNLLLVLLDTDVPLTLQHIVHTVEGYPEGHDAYRQAFERDKRLLREQGVNVAVEPIAGSDVSGYRIRPEEYFLPDPGLTEAEQQALNLALAAVRVDPGAGQDAAWKLGAPGVLTAPPSVPMARLPTAPALPVLHEAMRARSTVTFVHRGRVRRVDPYGLLFRRGFWYVVGRDHDRDAMRSFRVDRIEGLPEAVAGTSFERPAGFDAASALPEDPWLIGEGDAVVARVRVDAVHGPLVESELGSAAVAGREADGSVTFDVPVVNVDAFRTWLLGLLDHAEVLAPDALRRAVVDWVTPLAAR